MRPRVIIVPGLSGTRLGRRGPMTDDVVWLSLGSVRAGRLLELASASDQAVSGSVAPLEPLDAFGEVYLQLQIRLQLAGYDVAMHPYDWRRPLADLGADLAARVRAEGREVHLVAHSLGGVVARAAAMASLPNLGKTVMLGPPNHGTFSVVQGIRGSHWVLWALAALDPDHTAAELAEGAFATWPSVYGLLPPAARAGDVDLYDPAVWPRSGPQPRPDLLRAGRGDHAQLGVPAGEVYVIAGTGVPTVQRVEMRAGVFHYHRSDDGDGWVPTERARLDVFPCYYVRAPHVGMPNHAVVIAAVEDLLARGTTDRLPTVAPAPTFFAPQADDDVPELPGGLALEASGARAAFDELAGFVVTAPLT